MITTTPDAAIAAVDESPIATTDTGGIAPASVTETLSDAAPPAARHAEQDAPPVLFLSLSGAPNLETPERSTPMQLTPEQLAAGKEALGNPELPDAEVFDTLVAAAIVGGDDAGTVQTQTQELSRLQGELEESKVALSRLSLSREGTAPVVDPEALMDRADVSLSRIDLAVERGDMLPFVADKLKKCVKSDAGPSVVMLSREASLGTRPFDFIMSLFEGSKSGVKTGEQSGAQVQGIALSRETPGEDPAKAKEGQPLTQEVWTEAMEKAGKSVTKDDYAKYIATRNAPKSPATSTAAPK